MAPIADEVSDDRRAHERLCVATRAVRPVGELIRFVASPDGVLTPDLKRRLPGRGVSVTASAAAYREAVRRNAFARGLKRPVAVPETLEATIDQLLERAALDMLSMANKAGLVVAGTAKVEARLREGRAVAWLVAREAAEDGVRKLAAAARNPHIAGPAPIRITIFESAHLDLALGRANVIHAALGAGPAASGFLERIAALRFWRDGGLVPVGPGTARETPPDTDDEHSMRDGRPATDEAASSD